MDFKELIEYDLKDYLKSQGLIIDLEFLYFNPIKLLTPSELAYKLNDLVSIEKFENYKIQIEVKAKVYYQDFIKLNFNEQYLIYDTLKKKYKSSIPDYNEIKSLKFEKGDRGFYPVPIDFVNPLNDYFFQYLVELIDSNHKFEDEIKVVNSRKNFKEFNENLYRAPIQNHNFKHITDSDKIFQTLKYLMDGVDEGEKKYLSVFSENDFINFYKKAFLNEELPKVTPKNLNRKIGKFISYFHNLYSALEGIGINEFGEKIKRGGSKEPYIDLIHLNINGFEKRAKIENNFR